MEGFYVLLGTVLGFLLGLLGSEVRTSRQRSQRRVDVAKLVRAEIAVNQEKLVDTLRDHRKAADDGTWVLTSPFRHEAFDSCMADLSLLGDEPLAAIQSFYARLAHLERVPTHALSTLTQEYVAFRAGKQDQDDAELQEKHVWQIIHAWVLEREDEVLQAADKAIASLDQLIAQHKPWRQRVLGQ
jgi:hypothetical protein